MSLKFTITFDYLCPFARNANEHVIAALQGGADWEVAFTPYSLTQGHVAEGEPAIWDREDPDAESGVLALQVGLAVRDRFPEQFLDAHRELFAARHDRGEDIRDRDVLAKALEAADLDPDAVFEVVDTGEFLATLRAEHETNVDTHNVWGVPTIITGQRAVFLRLLDRPGDEGAVGRDRIERVVELLDGFPELHEFKQVDLPF